MPLKLNEQIAEEIRARIKSLEPATIEKLAKAKDKNGTFDVIISTEDVDRSGDIVRQAGWDLTNYKNNPIVLWGHDYYSLPIGVCTETYITEQNGVPALGAKGFFYSADINPLAQQVRKMYDLGIQTGHHVGCTTSVGFIPKEFDENSFQVITRAELLEFSFVPVPANQAVGPAQGRALTFAEAKELGLDIEAMRTKGLEFVEKIEGEEDAEQKEAAGDDCTMDDGTAGELSSDDDGNLVCVPKDNGEKAAAERDSQKKLLTSVSEENERHVGEIEKAIDALQDGLEEQSDAEAVKSALPELMRDLRDSVQDEHTMHRARSIACFRSFDPAEDQAFDTKAHVKAVRDANEEYETRVSKTIEQFEIKLTAEPAKSEEHLEWLGTKLGEATGAHKKAITRMAKTMCKAAFGEEEHADEKVLEILSLHLKNYVPEPLQRAVYQKIGAQISAATKKTLGEAHEHLKAASAIVKALHGDLGDDEGEESRSEGEGKSAPAPAPKKQRSRPAEVPQKDELDAHLLSREVLREMTTAAQRGLEILNKRGKR